MRFVTVGQKMKTIRDRYTVRISVADYEKMRDEIYKEALADGAKQGVAVCLRTLETVYQWKGKRLTVFTDNVNETLHTPAILGRDITGEDAINYLKDNYNIDLDSLKVDVEL